MAHLNRSSLREQPGSVLVLSHQCQGRFFCWCGSRQHPISLYNPRHCQWLPKSPRVSLSRILVCHTRSDFSVCCWWCVDFVKKLVSPFPPPSLIARAETSSLGCCWRRRQWKNLSAHCIQPEILPRGINTLFYPLISLEIRSNCFWELPHKHYPRANGENRRTRFMGYCWARGIR